MEEGKSWRPGRFGPGEEQWREVGDKELQQFSSERPCLPSRPGGGADRSEVVL